MNTLYLSHEFFITVFYCTIVVFQSNEELYEVSMKKAMATVETMKEQRQDRQLLSQRYPDEVDGDNEVVLYHSLHGAIDHLLWLFFLLSIWLCDRLTCWA